MQGHSSLEPMPSWQWQVRTGIPLTIVGYALVLLFGDTYW
jgi:hypothetical protein